MISHQNFYRVATKSGFLRFFDQIFAKKFFHYFKNNPIWGFLCEESIAALKNLEITSLTPNQPKNHKNCKNPVFWANLGSGKRFQDFSVPSIDSSHRKTHIGLF